MNLGPAALVFIASGFLTAIPAQEINKDRYVYLNIIILLTSYHTIQGCFTFVRFDKRSETSFMHISRCGVISLLTKSSKHSIKKCLRVEIVYYTNSKAISWSI